jgi:hypothetical protein
MTKPRFRHFGLFAILCLLLSCGKPPFDPSTNEGATVINNLDPTIADFNTAYRVIDTTAAVDSVASRRAPLAWENALEVGNFNGERSIGYFGFDTLFRFSNQTIDSIDSVALYIPLAAGAEAHLRYTTVRLFAGAKKDTSSHALVDTSAKAPFPMATCWFDSSHTVDTVYLSLAQFRNALRLYQQPDTIVTRVLDSAACAASPAAVCTLTVPDTVYRPADTAHIIMPDSGFYLFPDQDTILRLGIPYVTVYFHYGSPATTGAQNQNALRIEHSPLETNPDSLDRVSRSSYLTGRYTVLKLNLAALWDSAKAPVNGKRFVMISGCNITIPFDTTPAAQQFFDEVSSPLLIFYHLSTSPTDTAASLFQSNSTDMTLATIQDKHAVVLNVQRDANALYNGGATPNSDCYLFIKIASTDASWRWADWKISAAQKPLVVQATAGFPR